jgi:hypothetical protein
VHIRSAHCDISLVEAAKYGFEDVITLHAAVSPASSPKMDGSDFELQGVSGADIKAAKDFFLRSSGERVLETTAHGQILERTAGRDARASRSSEWRTPRVVTLWFERSARKQSDSRIAFRIAGSHFTPGRRSIRSNQMRTEAERHNSSCSRFAFLPSARA